MKTLFIIAAACTLGLLASLVVGQEQQQPLPPGVAAADWIPVGDKVGFVVTHGANQDPAVLGGYFLAWHQNSWKRLDSQGGFRFHPVQK
jgi:hypothetical protein